MEPDAQAQRVEDALVQHGLGDGRALADEIADRRVDLALLRRRQQAMMLADRLRLFGRSVYFLDAVKESELVAAAAEAEVGIVPYRPLIINDRLSCPNKLSQYLHAGLMVIANDLPYVKSVLAEADAGLFYDSANLDTFAAVVHQIVNDPVLLRRSRENALRFARDRFNWQVQSKTLYALYDSAKWGEGSASQAVIARAAE